MKFQKITLNDIVTIQPFFNHLYSKTCDFSVGGMFMWRKYYDMEYKIENNIFFSKLRNEQGTTYFNLPISENIEDAISENITKWYKKKYGIKFCTIPEEYVPYFEQFCPNAVITEQTDYFDYLYNPSDLIHLKGKKYNSQRNLISQFKRNNVGWQFIDINLVPIEKVINFFLSLYSTHNVQSITETMENQMTLEVLQNMDKYKFLGGVLMIDEKIVGFSLGEIINNTLFTHIEKADRSYKGAYQLLTNKFAEMFGDNVSFINREEDMGDLGLRKAKESYHPASLLKKYTIEIF